MQAHDLNEEQCTQRQREMCERAIAERRGFTKAEEIDYQAMEDRYEYLTSDEHKRAILPMPKKQWDELENRRKKMDTRDFTPEKRQLDSFLRGEIRGLTLQGDLDTKGGFAINTQFSNELVQEKKRLTKLRQLCRTITLTSGDGIRFPKLGTRPTAPSWTSELSIGAQNTAVFEAIQFFLHPHRTFIRISKDLIDSSQVDIWETVRNEFAYAFAWSEEQAFISGNGAGRPLGFMVTGANGAGVGTSRDVSEGNSTTQISADGLINAFMLLEPQYQANATWIFHPDAIKQVRKLKTGAGDFLWRQGLASDAPNTILDRPVYTSYYMPNTFSTGELVGCVADFQAGYWICEFNRFEVQVLLELYAGSNEVGYIGKSRLDAQPVIEAAFSRVKLA